MDDRFKVNSVKEVHRAMTDRRGSWFVHLFVTSDLCWCIYLALRVSCYQYPECDEFNVCLRFRKRFADDVSVICDFKGDLWKCQTLEDNLKNNGEPVEVEPKKKKKVWQQKKVWSGKLTE